MAVFYLCVMTLRLPLPLLGVIFGSEAVERPIDGVRRWLPVVSLTQYSCVSVACGGGRCYNPARRTSVRPHTQHTSSQTHKHFSQTNVWELPCELITVSNFFCWFLVWRLWRWVCWLFCVRDVVGRGNFSAGAVLYAPFPTILNVLWGLDTGELSLFVPDMLTTSVDVMPCWTRCRRSIVYSLGSVASLENHTTAVFISSVLDINIKKDTHEPLIVTCKCLKTSVETSCVYPVILRQIRASCI